MNNYNEKQELISLFNEIGGDNKVITAWSEYGEIIITKNNLTIYEDSKIIYIEKFSDIDELSAIKEIKSDDYKFYDFHIIPADEVYAYNTIKRNVLKNGEFKIIENSKNIYWYYSDWEHTITVYKDSKLISTHLFSDIEYDTEMFSSGLEGEFEVVYNFFKKICNEHKIYFKIN